jgi:hypothetical protein
MSTLKDLQEYIDQYRSGEISESKFKQHLESDEALQQEFELSKRDLLTIKSAAKDQLRKKASLALENHENKSQKIFSLKRVMQIAAVITLLAIAFFLIQNLGQPQSSAELFATHFELPTSQGERSNSIQSEIWNNAMSTYENQDFEKTIKLLSTLVNEPDFQFPDRGNLYLGLSYLMANKDQKAINNFNAISMQSTYFQNAEWFRALSFLKMENTVNAKIAFQKIADQPKHFKQNEAKVILGNL